MSEFARRFDLRHLPAGAQELSASGPECAALAERFGLVAVKRLEARVELIADGEAIRVKGRFEADIVQSCAVSGEDLAVRIAEPVALRFVPAPPPGAAEPEIDLEADDLDEIAIEGGQLDLGEALAQSLALAIDPYATGPDAERARQQAGLLGEAEAGPFAQLAALRGKGNESH